METLILFLTILAYFGAAVSTFMIFMYIRADHQLNHTAGGEIRQMMANIEGNKITIKPVGKYVIILTISGAWLIASYSL
jgi:hypothetical protein